MDQIQAPARCLFPKYTASSAQINKTPTKNQVAKSPVPFSIGDIMKSVSIHSHRDGVLGKTQITDSSRVGATNTSFPLEESHELDQAIVTTKQGLQLEHLLLHQKSDSPRTVDLHRTSYNPFITFLDRSIIQNTQGRPAAPPMALNLSLHHLQSCPELPFPSVQSCPELSNTSMNSQHQQRTCQPDTNIGNKMSSPSSDVCDDLIDVESTSPNGSTASSGFYSNPSPTPSSDSSSMSGRTSPNAQEEVCVSERTSPSTQEEDRVSERTSPNTQEEERVSANLRKNYTKKQVRRLKQVFLENKYPDVELYEDLSQELDIPVQRLKVWFQNRRARNKRASDSRIKNYSLHQQNMAAMLSSAPGYGYLSPMMHQSVNQYPVPHVPMMYPPSLYPGYPYPFHYQQ
ncbi:segmentation polarity homeobox protein engrailed-like [Haliotis rufescens]|uniref:segmentation polarity homeobox protein engrailed-like n=1 Tax=Haliotis rufescens TaxID=6454 RepID=UPI001EAFE20B|nr:segmentation polarity homeobox protein engrailed-like [Haliotis rufescens]